MPKVTTLDGHPLVRTWLANLRDERTGPEGFRRNLELITLPLLFEATSALRTSKARISTPMGAADGFSLQERVAVAAILRAALGMVTAIQSVIPSVSIYHIDMHRDEETLKPVWIRDNLPSNCGGLTWLVPDPMLATGGSAKATLDVLKQRGAQEITFIGVVAAPEGIRLLQRSHPDVPMVIATIDADLTDGLDGRPKGYIVPGLGDAGDRQFGTVQDHSIP